MALVSSDETVGWVRADGVSGAPVIGSGVRSTSAPPTAPPAHPLSRQRGSRACRSKTREVQDAGEGRSGGEGSEGGEERVRCNRDIISLSADTRTLGAAAGLETLVGSCSSGQGVKV